MALQNEKWERFAREYIVDLNGSAAYQRAGYRAKGHSAEANAERLLRNAEVKARIAELLAERAQRVEVKADDVLRRFFRVANANPNELIEYRRVACRWCHGRNHRYQFTPAEMERARRQWEREVEKAAKDGRAPPAFDEHGGIGYDPRKPPHPDCPECFGEGTGEPFVKDTRNLSPEALALYAGVKVTKDGVEVKLNDQQTAWLNIAKHLGWFNEPSAIDELLRRLDPDFARKVGGAVARLARGEEAGAGTVPQDGVRPGANDE